MSTLLDQVPQDALGADAVDQKPSTQPQKPPAPESVRSVAKAGGKSATEIIKEGKGRVGDLTTFFMSKFEAVLKQSDPKTLATMQREVGIMDVYMMTSDQGAYIRQACTLESIIAALLVGVTSGLSISHNHYAIVPYGKKAQFQLQYQGVYQLVRNFGQVAYIEAKAVRRGDLFRYEYGLNRDLKHIPKDGCYRNEVTHAYCIVTYVTGHQRFEVLDREQIESRRLRNHSQKDNPSGSWATDYDQMAIAKAIKATLKSEPKALSLPAWAKDGARVDLRENPTFGGGVDGFVQAEFDE